MSYNIWKDYDAETKYPDVTAYILKLIRENKKLEEKLEAIKALAPEILSWMATGVDWACSESRERGAEKKMQAEHNETVKQFKELLGIEEAS